MKGCLSLVYLQGIVFDSMLTLPQDGHGNFSSWPSGALGVSALQAARLRTATSEILYDPIQFKVFIRRRWLTGLPGLSWWQVDQQQRKLLL